MFPEAAQYDMTRIPGQVAGIDPVGTARMKMLTGHLFYGLHNGYDNFQGYITLLRESVDRVVSFYNEARLRGKEKPESVVKIIRERN